MKLYIKYELFYVSFPVGFEEHHILKRKKKLWLRYFVNIDSAVVFVVLFLAIKLSKPVSGWSKNQICFVNVNFDVSIKATWQMKIEREKNISKIERLTEKINKKTFKFPVRQIVYNNF